MTKTIKEKFELTKNGDKYEYVSEGVYELSEKAFDSNVNNLARNIEAIQTYLDNFEKIKEEKWRQKKAFLLKEFEAAKYAYDNYDESVKELIRDIEDKKEEKREIIKKFIENHESNLKKQRELLEQELEKEKEAFTKQLGIDKPYLELYEKADKERVDKKREEIRAEIKRLQEEQEKELEEQEKVSENNIENSE